MGRKPLPLKDSNSFTLDELGTLSIPTMRRALSGMSEERKKELLAECEEKVQLATEMCCKPGQTCADSKGITRYPSPYTLIKKYSNLYAAIAGYQTEEDLNDRALEKAVREGNLLKYEIEAEDSQSVENSEEAL